MAQAAQNPILGQLNLSLGSLNGLPEPQYTLQHKFDYFSTDSSGRIDLDDRQKKFLNKNAYPIGESLSEDVVPGAGLQVHPQAEVENEIGYILKWTALNIEHSGSTGSQNLHGGAASGPPGYGSLKDVYGGADIVTDYMVLQLAAEAPYKKVYGRMIVATRYKGLIYLCQFSTPEWKNGGKKPDGQNGEAIYAYPCRKFERLMTKRDTSGAYPRRDEGVYGKENLHAASVVKLAGTKIFIRFEVKCFDLDSREKVQLRPCTFFARQDPSPPPIKALHAWLYNHLTRTQRVIFGLRSRDNNILADLLPLRTTEIPGYAAEGKQNPPWEPKVCMAALDRFLGFVKRQMGGAEDLQYVSFELAVGGGVKAFMEADPQFHFLNQEFLEATKNFP